MNDKDKEAFEKWYEDQKYWYNSWEDNYMQDGLIVSLPGEIEQAWQAALEYERFNHKYCVVGFLDKLQAENKKLREALEFYASYDNWRKEFANKLEYNAHRIKDDFTLDENFTPYGGKRAREALKKVGELC